MIDDRFEELTVRECRIGAFREYVENMETIKDMITRTDNGDYKSNASRQRYLRVVLRIQRRTYMRV